MKRIPLIFLFCAIMQYIGGGFAGLQGVLYAGTNCFHRRKVIYGLSPSDNYIQNGNKESFSNGTHHHLRNSKMNKKLLLYDLL